MNTIQRYLIAALSLLWGCAALYADEVSFRAQAPSQVIAGQPFQLTYTVNQRARDLQAPDFQDFDYLAGPYTSQSSSTSFVNGRRTSLFTLTYTYTLRGNHEGTFSLPPATIRVDGETYTSNGLKITVLPPDEEPAYNNGNGASQRPSAQQNSQARSSAGTETAGNGNVFIRTIVSKTHVQEQEALQLSYKLYFAGVDVAQFTNNTKLPEFTGFLKQDLEQGEIQTELEHYNGRNYQTATLYRTLLYPQHSGEIKIDPAQFEAVLRVQVRQQVRSIFDDFFGTYENVTKGLTAPGVTIKVDALPSGKPASFSGGVGQFRLSGDISATTLKTNEPVTITLAIQGTGNMKLLKTPSVDWPEGFEAYDAKVTNDFKTTSAGVSGSKKAEYLAIPRAAGDYTIPAIVFSYYDTADKQYKTQQIGPWSLHIERGKGDTEAQAVVQNYVGKEDIKQLGTDIRYLHTDALQYATPSRIDLRHRLLWLYMIPALIALGIFILFRRQIKENADLTRLRYKKANKVAQKRLKEARRAMDGNNSSAFYEAIERAAWSYLSDRLSIPTAELNKDNIASILAGKQVPESLVNDVRDVLSTAEFARYAPAGDNAMQELYDKTATLINNLENQKI